MIILGYPGIGKSAVCKNRSGWIDLESSNFDLKTDDGVIQYCEVAMDLSDQGKTVFVSTHENVRKFFESVPKQGFVAVVYPKLELKEAWIKRLTARYNKTGLIKDRRALSRAEENYEKDIEALMTSPLTQIQISSDHYNLKTVLGDFIVKTAEGFGILM